MSLVYKIENHDGLFWGGKKWSKHGKFYSSRGHVKSALNYRRALMEIHKVVIISFITEERARETVEEFLKS